MTKTAAKKNDARTVREAFKLNPTEMAELMGVNYTTWYRWEQSGTATADPLHQKLLAFMMHSLKEMSETDRLWWIDYTKTSLQLGGTLRGLAALLSPLVEKK